MITTKSGTEIKTIVTESELKEAFTTPRKYYEFMKKLHKQMGIPWFDELDVLEWVKEEEAKNGRSDKSSV